MSQLDSTVVQNKKPVSLFLNKPYRSVFLFLWWFFFVSILFLFWSLYMKSSSYKDLLSSWDWLFLLFGIQQLLTLWTLFASVYWWGLFSRDDVSNYFYERWRRKWFRFFWIRVIWGFFFYIICNALLFTWLQFMWWDIPWLYGEQSVMTLISELQISTWFDRFLTVLMVVFLWPIVEELVYRWLITDVFMRSRWFRWVLIWAVIFAFIHMEFAVIWNLFILALILWIIYQKTESMRYSFLFHMIINGMGLFVLWFEKMYNMSSLWV